MNIKYTFSGHESFPCKSLWLKKGYDFVNHERNFNAPDAVIDLEYGFIYSFLVEIFWPV